jgi:tetratricopeptide (TPR) repeat protein
VRLALSFAGLFAVTLAAYLPALRGELLWDDAGHITHPELRSWGGLVRIWFEIGATQQYYPLLHSAFWLEHRLWGDHVLGYHLVNVLWHALAATLFATLLRRLEIRGALLAAAVFALHPVCVESVAWISEQKNTLSLVLYLAAALAWLRYDDERTPRRYAIATAWFVAALLTKSVTATLPPALLVLAWWRRGRLSWRADVRPLLPWLALGVFAGLGTAWMEATQIGAKGEDFALGPVERVLLAGRVVWFYAAKLVWPADLAFFYPRWTVDAGVWWQWLYPLAAGAALGAAAWWSRRDRAPLAAALLFGGTLFPALGFVNVYPFIFSYVADHFQYHACLALIAFLVAVAARGWPRLGLPRAAGVGVAGGVLVLCATLTWRQSAEYRDVITLYRATLEKSPDSWVAHLNLGVALEETGRTTEALPHLQRANELKPDFPQTLNSLGNALARSGRPAEARPLLERALQLQPRFAAAHNTLGTVLMALQQPEAGIASFRRALEIDRQLTSARVNLAWALANTGHMVEALTQLEQARREQPDNAEAELKTGLVLAMTNRLADAAAHVQRAVALAPQDPEMHHVFGLVLLELGEVADAAEQFEAALQLAPTHAGAQQGLAIARQRLGR